MAHQPGVGKERMLDTGEAVTADTDKKMDKHQHANEEKNKNEHVQVLAVCLIVVTILLLAVLLGLVVYWREVRKINVKPKQQTICLKCDDMGLASEELPSQLKGKISRELKHESEECQCCGEASNVLDWLIAKAIQDRGTAYQSEFYQLESKACKQTTKSMPSAQVYGISTSEMATGKAGVIHWDTTDSSFMKGGVSYKDGTISVEQPGYYYIFTQITISHNSLDDLTSEVKHETHGASELIANNRVNHYMHRHSAKIGSTWTILEGSKSRCEITSSTGETSSIGAVFYLEENDGIFVNISHPHALVPGPEGNHFGLYMT